MFQNRKQACTGSYQMVSSPIRSFRVWKRLFWDPSWVQNEEKLLTSAHENVLQQMLKKQDLIGQHLLIIKSLMLHRQTNIDKCVPSVDPTFHFIDLFNM